MYGVNARAELTSALTRVVLDATILPTRAPPRVITDVALLLAVLHCRIGHEVTAKFLHQLIDTYQRLSANAGISEVGKQTDNALLLLAQLYNFKVCYWAQKQGLLFGMRHLQYYTIFSVRWETDVVCCKLAVDSHIS